MKCPFDDIHGKTVFIRVDYNLPISEDHKILDHSRIIRALDTVTKCSEKGAKVLLATHLGYPGGKFATKLDTGILKPIIEKYLGKKIQITNSCIYSENKEKINAMAPGDILLLQNLRFYTGELEDTNEFGSNLVSGCDIYINDAFSVSHRKHASVSSVSKSILHKLPGISLQKEFDNVTSVLSKKNSIAVIGGGWKAVEKIGVVENLAKKMEHVLIGGALAQLFLLAKEAKLKPSIKLDKSKIVVAKNLLNQYSNIELPEDFVVLVGDKISIVSEHDLTEEMQLLDIGPKTIQKFNSMLSNADVVFWNGPLGKYEDPRFANGTKALANHLVTTSAKTVACGADTTAAIKSFSLEKEFSYLSTGGGAALTLLAGQDMPGLRTVGLTK